MTTIPSNHTPAASAATVFVYFVAIQYFGDDGGIGFVNMAMPLPVQILSLQGVQIIEGKLRDNGWNRALVLGFNLLRTESVQAGGAR